MSRLQWLLILTVLWWSAAAQAQSLEECLANATIDCALAQAVIAANAVKTDGQRGLAYSYIARVAADGGRYADARRYYDEASVIKRGLIEVNFRDAISGNQVRVHAMMGEFGEAISLADGIANKAVASRSWSWIAHAQAIAGDRAGSGLSLDRALEMAAEMSQDRLAFSMALMGVVRADQGEREDALGAVDAALELADRYEPDIIRVRVAALAMVARAVAGESELAKEALVSAEAGLRRMEQDGATARDLSSAMSYIAWSQALSGDGVGAQARLHEMINLVPEVVDPYYRSIYLAAIALVLTKSE
jgi:tetratricopeptide (TPR) repeat protein